MLHRRRLLTAATRGLALGGVALLVAHGAQAQPSGDVYRPAAGVAEADQHLRAASSGNHARTPR